MLEHNELVEKAVKEYEASELDYGTPNHVRETLNKMNDAFIWGFIGYCKNNRVERNFI